MVMTKIFFIISFIFVFINASLIYENRPSSVLLSDFKNEMLKVQSSQSISKLDFGTYSYNTTLGSLLFSSFKQELNYFDVNRLKIGFTESDSLEFKGDAGALSLKYSFQYNLSDSSSFKANFSLDSVNLEIMKGYSINNDTILKSDAVLKVLDFKINDVQSEVNSHNSELKSGLESLMVYLAGNIAKSYSEDISSFFSSVQTSKTIIPITSNDPKLNFTLDMTYDRVPKKLGDGLVFYMSGSINDHNNTHIEPSKISTDSYGITIHKEVLRDFLYDLSNDGMLDYTLKGQSGISDLPFNLNIQSLGNVIPELYDSYPRAGSIEIWNKFSDFSLNDDLDSSKGIFTLSSEIYHQDTMRTLLSFQTKIIFKLKSLADLENSTVNFYLDDNVDISSINVDSHSYSIVYYDVLKKWVEASLKSYLGTYPYFLLDSPIDLSGYFSSLSKAFNNEIGFVLVGTPAGLIFPELKDDKEDEIKVIHFGILKFLS